MKKFTVFLFTVIALNSTADLFSGVNYWLRQTSPTGANLKRSAFADSMNVWAVGDSGVIIYTSNGGLTWVKQNSQINVLIEDVFFLNKRLGWALANDFFNTGTIILKTTNGGINWTNSRYPDTTFALYTVYYLDSLNGYMAGSSGTIIKTTNAGSTWNKCRLEQSSFFNVLPILRIHFVNQQTGLACGGAIDIAGTMWKTTDFGLNWAITDTVAEPLVDVINYNSTLAFTSGGDYEYGCTFSYSFNGGSTWIDSNIAYFGVGNRIAIRTIRDIWIPLTFSTKWINSKDSGKSWIEYSTEDTNAVYDAIFIDSIRGWAFGDKGRIYKYNRQLISIEDPSTVPDEFMLYQNYPNPFNPETTIKFSLRNVSDVKIILYDLLGREVKELLNSRKNSGSHELKFSSDELSSGVYFYKIIADGFTDSKKLVILK